MLYNVDFEKQKKNYEIKMIKSLLNVKLRMEDMRQKLDQKLITWTKDHEEAYINGIKKLELVMNNLESTIMIFRSF